MGGPEDNLTKLSYCFLENLELVVLKLYQDFVLKNLCLVYYLDCPLFVGKVVNSPNYLSKGA